MNFGLLVSPFHYCLIISFGCALVKFSMRVFYIYIFFTAAKTEWSHMKNEWHLMIENYSYISCSWLRKVRKCELHNVAGRSRITIPGFRPTVLFAASWYKTAQELDARGRLLRALLQTHYLPFICLLYSHAIFLFLHFRKFDVWGCCWY